MNARLIICDNCGKALSEHCRKHWVSGPHCPGHCKTGEQTWSQPDGGDEFEEFTCPAGLTDCNGDDSCDCDRLPDGGGA
jgi:hypothetical protein